MLILRQDQIDVLSQAALTRLEKRMLAHVYKYWPKECDTRGAEGTLSSVQESIDKCRARGLTQEYDIGRYIDLVFFLSDDFEQLPWAQEALNMPAPNARVRMEYLWQSARKQPRIPDRAGRRKHG